MRKFSWLLVTTVLAAVCFLRLSQRAGVRRSELELIRPVNDAGFVDGRRNGQAVLMSLFGQIDFLQYRNMCLAACRASLAEENPSESSIHCRSDTLTPRWLDYIHSCDRDPRQCEIKAMGCRGWILA
jgi:hypothetical protein